jgi:hypothetical protein
MQCKQHHFSWLDGLRLSLRLVMALASPIVTALPASALAHNSPLAIAHHRQESRTAGADLTLQRDDDLR